MSRPPYSTVRDVVLHKFVLQQFSSAIECNKNKLNSSNNILCREVGLLHMLLAAAKIETFALTVHRLLASGEEGERKNVNNFMSLIVVVVTDGHA